MQKRSFEELIKQNKLELMDDRSALDKIEDKIAEKHQEKINKLLKKTTLKNK